MATTIRVPGFLPSTNGFHFGNSWPHEPTLTIPFPTGPIKVGDAAGGLCGGMAFAVRDFFESASHPGHDDEPATAHAALRLHHPATVRQLRHPCRGGEVLQLPVADPRPGR